MVTDKIIKEPIHIRQKKLANGNLSLYLDIYINGMRSYEFLRLYIIPERNREDKERNRQTMQLANSIKSKRIMDIQNGEFGFRSLYKLDTLFFEYFRAMCNRRIGSESRGNWGNWISCLHHLMKYAGNERITFERITPEWVQGFRDYLDRDAIAWDHDSRKRVKGKPLSENSKQSYFNKLRACLNQAYEDRIIPENPCRGIDGFKGEETTRMYLTIDEVKRLLKRDAA